MRINGFGETWTVTLETSREAQALLAAQISPAGDRITVATTPNYDRVAIGKRATELLAFASLTLPTEPETNEGVAFPLEEAEHLSHLMYSALSHAQRLGTPKGIHNDVLADMNWQLVNFSGTDAL